MKMKSILVSIFEFNFNIAIKHCKNTNIYLLIVGNSPGRTHSPGLGTSDEFQIEEAMISSSSAECADDGMH